MNERLARIELLLGAENVEKLKQSHIAIVGVGAVGGFAAEALVRSGVGKITLVDFDKVEPSNINRQILAMESTIGMPKVEAARQRYMDINPELDLNVMQTFAHTNTFDQIFEQVPDLVIDAIDSFNPKVELLCYLQKHNIEVISSMGAALQRDPSCIKTGKLTGSCYCPLAKIIRKHLRRRGFGTDLWCVYSTEQRDPAALAKSNEDGEDFGSSFEGSTGRKRNILGSLPTVTGIFGLTIANKAIELICA